jgi:hypothetical protein
LETGEMMTASVQEILETFDRLTNSEQIDLTVEILKRTAHQDLPLLSDDTLSLKNRDLTLYTSEMSAVARDLITGVEVDND